MDSLQSNSCQNCTLLLKKLQLFELLKQKCSRSDEIAVKLMQLSQAFEKAQKLLLSKQTKLNESKNKVKELEAQQKSLLVRIVSSNAELMKCQEDLVSEQNNHSIVLKIKDDLEVKLNAACDENVSLKLLKQQLDERLVENQKKADLDTGKSKKMLRARKKDLRRVNVLHENLRKKHDKLINSLLSVADEGPVNSDSLKKINKILSTLKSRDEAAKLEAELNSPTLTPDGTTSSDMGIFSGDEDPSTPLSSASLRNDLELSSDDESIDVFNDAESRAKSANPKEDLSQNTTNCSVTLSSPTKLSVESSTVIIDAYTGSLFSPEKRKGCQKQPVNLNKSPRSFKSVKGSDPVMTNHGLYNPKLILPLAKTNSPVVPNLDHDPASFVTSSTVESILTEVSEGNDTEADLPIIEFEASKSSDEFLSLSGIEFQEIPSFESEDCDESSLAVKEVASVCPIAKSPLHAEGEDFTTTHSMPLGATRNILVSESETVESCGDLNAQLEMSFSSDSSDENKAEREEPLSALDFSETRNVGDDQNNLLTTVSVEPIRDVLVPESEADESTGDLQAQLQMSLSSDIPQDNGPPAEEASHTLEFSEIENVENDQINLVPSQDCATLSSETNVDILSCSNETPLVSSEEGLRHCFDVQISNQNPEISLCQNSLLASLSNKCTAIESLDGKMTDDSHHLEKSIISSSAVNLAEPSSAVTATVSPSGALSGSNCFLNPNSPSSCETDVASSSLRSSESVTECNSSLCTSSNVELPNSVQQTTPIDTSLLENQPLESLSEPWKASERIIDPVCKSTESLASISCDDFDSRNNGNCLKDHHAPSHCELDFELMLLEWRTPKRVLPFSEDLAFFDERHLVGVSEGSVHLEDKQRATTVSPVIQENNLEARDQEPNCSSTLFQTTETCRQDSGIESCRTLVSSNSNLFIADKKTPRKRSRGDTMESASSPSKKMYKETATSPCKKIYKESATSPLKKMCKESATSPLKKMCKESATSPVKQIIKAVGVNTEFNPLTCMSCSKKGLEQEETNKDSTTIPLMQSNACLDIDSDFGISNCHTVESVSKRNTTINLETEEASVVQIIGLQSNPHSNNFSSESKLLHHAMEILKITAENSSPILNLNEVIVEKLKQAIQTIMGRNNLSNDSLSESEENMPLSERRLNKSICSNSGCKFAILCDLQHYELHKAAKSSDLEGKIFLKHSKKKLKRLKEHKKKCKKNTGSSKIVSNVKTHSEENIAHIEPQNETSQTPIERIPSLCLETTNDLSPCSNILSDKYPESEACKRGSEEKQHFDDPNSAEVESVDIIRKAQNECNISSSEQCDTGNCDSSLDLQIVTCANIPNNQIPKLCSIDEGRDDTSGGKPSSLVDTTNVCPLRRSSRIARIVPNSKLSPGSSKPKPEASKRCDSSNGINAHKLPQIVSRPSRATVKPLPDSNNIINAYKLPQIISRPSRATVKPSPNSITRKKRMSVSEVSSELALGESGVLLRRSPRTKKMRLSQPQLTDSQRDSGSISVENVKTLTGAECVSPSTVCRTANSSGSGVPSNQADEVSTFVSQTAVVPNNEVREQSPIRNSVDSYKPRTRTESFSPNSTSISSAVTSKASESQELSSILRHQTEELELDPVLASCIIRNNSSSNNLTGKISQENLIQQDSPSNSVENIETLADSECVSASAVCETNNSSGSVNDSSVNCSLSNQDLVNTFISQAADLHNNEVKKQNPVRKSVYNCKPVTETESPRTSSVIPSKVSESQKSSSILRHQTEELIPDSIVASCGIQTKTSSNNSSEKTYRETLIQTSACNDRTKSFSKEAPVEKPLHKSHRTIKGTKTPPTSPRTALKPNKKSKLEKLRSCVSRVHPLAKSQATYQLENRQSRRQTPALSPVLLDGEHHSKRTHAEDQVQLKALALQRLREKGTMPLSAAASGRTVQLINMKFNSKNMVPKSTTLSKKGDCKEVGFRKRVVPVIRPEDRLSLMQARMGNQCEPEICHKNSPKVRPRQTEDGLASIQAEMGNQREPEICPKNSPKELPGQTENRLAPMQTKIGNQCEPEIFPTNSPREQPEEAEEAKDKIAPEKNKTSFFLIPDNSSFLVTSLRPIDYVIGRVQENSSTACDRNGLQHTENVVKAAIKRFIAAPLFTPAVLQKAIDALGDKNMAYSAQVITRDVVNCVEDDYDTPLMKTGNKIPHAPLLTPVQQQLVTLILQLSFQLEHFRALPHDVLKLVEYRVFRLGKAPEGERVIWLSRLHAALCRALLMRPKSLVFCWDALYAFKKKAHEIVLAVLQVWPSLLPCRIDFDQACPNTQVMLHILLSQVENKNPKNRSDASAGRILRKILQTSSPTHLVNSQTLLSNLTSKLIGGGGNFTSSAVVLLAKKESEKWALEQVVNAHLLPALESWRKADIDEVVAEGVIWALCSILRAIHPSSVGSLINTSLKLLSSDLLAETNTVSCDMQEVIVMGLALLSRHDIERVAFSLMSWKPKHANTRGLSHNLIDHLTGLVKNKARNLQWWAMARRSTGNSLEE